MRTLPYLLLITSHLNCYNGTCRFCWLATNLHVPLHAYILTSTSPEKPIRTSVQHCRYVRLNGHLVLLLKSFHSEIVLLNLFHLKLILASGKGCNNHGIILSASILVPLQGFWNNFAYIRPMYLSKITSCLIICQKMLKTKCNRAICFKVHGEYCCMINCRLCKLMRTPS